MVLHNRLKIKHLLKFSPIKRISIVLLLSGFSFALISTIWSIYLKGFLQSDSLVGFVSSFFIVVSFVSFFLIVPFVEKANKLKLCITSFFVVMIGYVLYSLLNNFYLILLVAIVVTVAVAFKIITLGLLIKYNSKRQELSENEGVAYTFSNLAYIIGPLAAGFILLEFGLNYVFLIAALFLLMSIIFLKIKKIKSEKPRKKIDNHVLKNFFDYFKQKERVRIYILSAGVTFWWSLVYTYIPLYIIENSNEQLVAIALFLVAVPIVLLEYPFGKLVGKYGYRKFFILGFFIPSLISFLCFFLAFNVYYIIAAVTLASIGLSMTEPTTESYFFDISRGKEDQKYFGPYNTAIDAGLLAGNLFGAVVLLFFQFKYIFLVYGIGMFFLFLISLKTRKIIEKNRK
jgi:MFS family permease